MIVILEWSNGYKEKIEVNFEDEWEDVLDRLNDIDMAGKHGKRTDQEKR